MKRGSSVGGTSPGFTAAPVSSGVVAVGDGVGLADAIVEGLDGTAVTDGDEAG
jgi:hypothetical protein